MFRQKSAVQQQLCLRKDVFFFLSFRKALTGVLVIINYSSDDAVIIKLLLVNYSIKKLGLQFEKEVLVHFCRDTVASRKHVIDWTAVFTASHSEESRRHICIALACTSPYHSYCCILCRLNKLWGIKPVLIFPPHTGYAQPMSTVAI